MNTNLLPKGDSMPTHSEESNRRAFIAQMREEGHLSMHAAEAFVRCGTPRDCVESYVRACMDRRSERNSKAA